MVDRTNKQVNRGDLVLIVAGNDFIPAVFKRSTTNNTDHFYFINKWVKNYLESGNKLKDRRVDFIFSGWNSDKNDRVIKVDESFISKEELEIYQLIKKEM